jgi:PhnB protein
MQFIPYLGFDGNCREAFALYEKVFKGKIVAMLKHSDTPAGAHVGPEMQELIMHARLTSPKGELMGGDAPPGQYKQPTSPCLSIMADTAEEAERIFAELSPGGKVVMPIQETFWAVRFAMLNDRYGTPWMINCEKPAPQG